MKTYTVMTIAFLNLLPSVSVAQSIEEYKRLFSKVSTELRTLKEKVNSLESDLDKRKGYFKTGFIHPPKNQYITKGLSGWKQLWKEEIKVDVDSFIIISIAGAWKTEGAALGVMIDDKIVSNKGYGLSRNASKDQKHISQTIGYSYSGEIKKGMRFIGLGIYAINKDVAVQWPGLYYTLIPK